MNYSHEHDIITKSMKEYSEFKKSFNEYEIKKDSLKCLIRSCNGIKFFIIYIQVNDYIQAQWLSLI